MVNKKFEVYTRFCNNCKNYYNTKRKYSKKCGNCRRDKRKVSDYE